MSDDQGDFIKKMELKLLEYQEMLDTCNRTKSNIETELLMQVHEEAEKRKAEGDNSLGNDLKRKAYYQELLGAHQTYPKIDPQIVGLVHDINLIRIELGYQKRKFYREMASIVAVIKEVSE